MSEAIDILHAIEDQLQAYAGLTGVSSWTRNDDMNDVVLTGKFPLVNLSVNKLKIGNADDMNIRDYERHTYTIQIDFAVRSKSKTTALSGTATTDGIWDMWDDIQAGIRSNMTFAGKVTATVWKPDLIIDAVKIDDGAFWVGGAVATFDVYKDIYVKRLNKYSS